MPWWLHLQAEIAGWWFEAGVLVGAMWILFMRYFPTLRPRARRPGCDLKPSGGGTG